MRKEEQTHEAVLAMLRNLDGKKLSPQSGYRENPLQRSPLKTATNEVILEEDDSAPVRRRVGIDKKGNTGRRSRRVGKFVEHLPGEEEMEQREQPSEEEKAEWRLSSMGPKLVMYEPAPWEEGPPTPVEPTPMAQDPSQPLEDIVEDDEDSDTVTNQYVVVSDTKPRLLTPPAEPTLRVSSGGHFPIYKLPPDVFPAPPTPRSPQFPLSPVSDFEGPKSPIKSPNLRARAGLKKIFLSTLRPRKRDDEPLSPSPTLSSTVTTPSLPTPTIRITSPFNPRRGDGSPIYDDDPRVGKLSPIEASYRLPELRLSRADWGEWGRQIAERL